MYPCGFIWFALMGKDCKNDVVFILLVCMSFVVVVGFFSFYLFSTLFNIRKEKVITK